MWDQNWRDPAFSKRTTHGTVLEENSVLLKQAEERCVSCPEYPPKLSEQTRERCLGHELSLLSWNVD